MNSQLIHLGRAFYIASVLIGVPAVAFLLFDAFRRLRRWWSPIVAEPAMVKNPDAILLMLEGISKSVSAIARVMGFFGAILFNVLTIIASVALGLSILFWFTARDLQTGQPWARVVAGVVLAIMLLMSLMALASSNSRQRKRWLLPLLVIVVSGYALRIVWIG